MAPRFQSLTDKKGNWRVSHRLLPYLWQYRYRVFAGLVFLVLARLANISVPIVLKEIVDFLEQAQSNAIVAVPLMLLCAYGSLRFFAILFNELRNIVFSRASVQIIHHISMEVFRHLHQLSLAFHLERKTGGLSRDIERGNSAITNFLRMIVFNIIPVVFEMGAVLLILWTQFDVMFTIVTIIMIIIYCAFTVSVTKWRIRFRMQMNESESSANTRSLDSLLNYETVKIFGNEEMEMRRYDKAMAGWVSASLKNNNSLSFLNSGQGLIIAIGLTFLMSIAAKEVLDQNMSMGDFVMINAFLIQLYIPLNFLGSIYRDLNHSLVDMERMFDLLDKKPDVSEKENARDLVIKKGEVEFKNINFSYLSDRPTLKNINFTIKGGTMIAVVGPSGSGKSTLSRLLLRFYDPNVGNVYIDGQQTDELSLASLREAMVVVPQDTVLFNETIGYNIAYGDPDASQEDIIEAAKIAQIHDFIEYHPQGYDILVGERGLKLSGGEKQRVAIARAALKQARILIFDEATSSLDSRSEKAIQHALERVSKDTTTLIIAHRLSTIVNADQIIVLDGGEIVEMGRHDELLENEKLYAQMWELQKVTELIEDE
ncbi:MAG: ATP-binding cassette domain-containing protein [Gammaproteobacteria bacterium]|nr:ATP-binding cassette domain-containing protein [Gammaproteobacteria bacterium]NKB63190.1 ATP-binding cassette domain-containing protein [Gammaproteobacteria bacterium]